MKGMINVGKRYILNSAVITLPGVYEYKLIDTKKMKSWLQDGNWESTIGYEETAKALEVISGIKIPVNRVQIKMQVSDEALVYRLTKRIINTEMKGHEGVVSILDCSEIGILQRLK